MRYIYGDHADDLNDTYIWNGKAGHFTFGMHNDRGETCIIMTDYPKWSIFRVK